MKKLHLGCGKRDFGEDWISIDGADYPHIKHKDVTKLPFKNNTIDEIYSSHLIAYFDRTEIVMILNEWKRVLKPDGVLRIATPDFEAMNELYINVECDLKDILGPLFGRMSMGDKTIYHKTTYDFNDLSNLLYSVGFKDVCKYEWQNTDHAHIDDHSRAHLPHITDAIITGKFKQGQTLISLNVECTK